MTSLRQGLAQAVRYTLVEPVQQEPRVLLLALSTIFITMGQGIVGPILPLLVRSLGMSAAMVGLAVSAFALARLISNIPAGVLTRLYGARIVLVLGAALSALGNLLTGLIPSYGPLLAFRFIAGLGSALFLTAAVSFVAEVSTTQNRGRLMTIYQSSFLLGITLGPSMGGITAAVFGLSAPFYLVAIVSAIAGVWTMARIPAHVGQAVSEPGRGDPHQQQGSKAKTGYSSLFLNRGFIAVNLIALGIFFTRGGANFNLWPLLGKERFLLDPGRLGLLLTVASATNLVCLPFVGAFADKLGRKALLVPSTFLFAISLLISAASPTTAIFALALAFYGVAQAMESAAANSYVADLAPQNQRSVALGIHRTFGDAGLVVGSPLLGFIADQLSISWALVINAGIVAIPGALFFFLVKEMTRERQAQTVNPTRH